jgi:hypothetical protein
VHRGSLGVVVQSTGVVAGVVVLHEWSLGVLVQSGTFAKLGVVCPHKRPTSSAAAAADSGLSQCGEFAVGAGAGLHGTLQGCQHYRDIE